MRYSKIRGEVDEMKQDLICLDTKIAEEFQEFVVVESEIMIDPQIKRPQYCNDMDMIVLRNENKLVYCAMNHFFGEARMVYKTSINIC